VVSITWANALDSESVSAGADGFVRSTRICVPAVLTASALPTRSTEKYLIV
jgi:hypothetical protein